MKLTHYTVYTYVTIAPMAYWGGVCLGMPNYNFYVLLAPEGSSKNFITTITMDITSNIKILPCLYLNVNLLIVGLYYS